MFLVLISARSGYSTKGPPLPDWQLLGGDSNHTSVPLQPLGSAQCWFRVNAYYAEVGKKKGREGGREKGT